MIKTLRISAFLLAFMILVFTCGCNQNDTSGKSNDYNPNQKITVEEPDSDSLDEYQKQGKTESDEVDNGVLSSSESETGESDKTESESGDGQGVSEQTATPQTSSEYYANKNTKKFHYKDCRAVRQMKPENIYVSNSREELLSSGFVPCAICNP